GREARWVVVGVAVPAEIAGRSGRAGNQSGAAFCRRLCRVFPWRGKTRRAHPQDYAVGGTDRRCQGRYGAGRGRLRAHRRTQGAAPRAGEIRRGGSGCRRPRALPLFQRNAWQYRRQIDCALNGPQEPGNPMQSSIRTPYDRVVMAVPVTIPYVRYSIESAQWWIGRGLKGRGGGGGVTPSHV